MNGLPSCIYGLYGFGLKTRCTCNYSDYTKIVASSTPLSWDRELVGEMRSGQHFQADGDFVIIY